MHLKAKIKDLRLYNENNNNILNDQINQLEKQNITLQTDKTLSENKILALQEEINQVKQHKNEMAELYSQYKDYIKQNSEALLHKFENFAANTLDANNNKFIQQSQQKLDTVLNPLKNKIEDFQRQVKEHYNKELEGRTNLNAEIKLIASESKNIAESCNNLSQILRGNQKLQGNWGELVLKKVLESSGLREGEEYYYQARMDSANDEYSIIDILISLPDKKHVVIDAKTSLKHYEAYYNSCNDNERCQFLRLFLESIKNHIKNLSSKEYQQAHNISSPDFTIMFIPIDSALVLALQNDHELQNFALKNNIIISSPSILIAILKTIASLWKLSRQNANAQKIASAAGEMYNKFCSFIQDMGKISTALDKAKLSYDSAFNKLYSGRGNLIKRSEDIKKMGITIKSDKNIPEELVDAALTNESVEAT